MNVSAAAAAPSSRPATKQDRKVHVGPGGDVSGWSCSSRTEWSDAPLQVSSKTVELLRGQRFSYRERDQTLKSSDLWRVQQESKSSARFILAGSNNVLVKKRLFQACPALMFTVSAAGRLCAFFWPSSRSRYWEEALIGSFLSLVFF